MSDWEDAYGDCTGGLLSASHRPLVNEQRRSGSLGVRFLQSVEWMQYG
jgi:hypothetical protein